MTKVIAGNWKMNGSRRDIKKWFQNFFKKVELFEQSNHRDIPEILVCVPSIYLPYAKQVAAGHNKDTEDFKIMIGAEDCHYEENGAYTGNISPKMLKEFEVEYVLVGHSERRHHERETSETVVRKATTAIKHEITPIVCVGEDLKTRESGNYLEFIAKQVFESTEGLDPEKFIIAYEPIWSIGTGKIPTAGEIEEVASYIKKVLSKRDGTSERDITVLYGGSVRASNVAEITGAVSVDGVLVGGASLNGNEFFDIVVKSA